MVAAVFWRKKVKLIQPYLNWGIAVVCFFVQLTISLSSGMLAGELSKEFQLDAFSVSLLMGMVFYPSICMQIPAGMITDRFGARRVLAVGALVCSIGAYGFAHAESFSEACFYRVIMGSGLSFAFVSMAYLTANWMRRESFSKMFCIAEMIALSCTVLAIRYLAAMLPERSWRDFITMISIAAFCLSIISAVFVRNRPSYLEDAQPSLQFSDITVQLKLFMKDGKMWANGIYSGLMFSCLSCFVAQWGPSFLSQATTMSLDDAATMCTTLTLGLVVGCPLLSVVLPKIKNIKMVLSISALITSISLSLVVMFPMMDHTTMKICLFVSGFFAVSYLIPFTIAHFYVRPGSKSTAIGFTNMLSIFFGPMLSLLIGFLIDYNHDAKTGVYTLMDYQYGMNVLPMTMFVASMVCYFVPMTHKAGVSDDI